MLPYVLEKTNWKQVKSENYNVVILPWGATEPHNYHLPYGTDSLETSKIAEEAAGKAWSKGARCMVLPTIPLGLQNPGQVDIPFCLNTSISTQKAILKDIVKSLYHQGFRKFVLLNGHGGNNFKGVIRGLQTKYSDMFLCLIEWFRVLNLKEYFEKKCDHAGEMETSIFLHYFPDLVLQPVEKEAGDGYANPFALSGLVNGVGWTPRDWAKVSDDTGVGDPRKATKEKGEKFLRDLIEKIADFFVELDGLKDLGDVYEKKKKKSEEEEEEIE